MFGLSLEVILGLSVVGTLVTVAGNLIASWLTNYVFVRWFEQWKARQALFNVYRRYRDPIVLAAIELYIRIDEISRCYPPDFLNSENLKHQAIFPRTNTQEDAHFQQYKLISTIYRLCALLGWLELYRQEVTFLDSGSNRVNLRFEACLRCIRVDLADGQLNEAEDWEEWSDRLIFREEQRAIGEVMICGTGPSRAVMGYGNFYELFDTTSGTVVSPWIEVVQQFVCDHSVNPRDFREVRLRRLVVDLVKLIELLDPHKMSKEMREWQKDAPKEASSIRQNWSWPTGCATRCTSQAKWL